VTAVHALVRVDAGRVGLGHLDRCVALAIALRERGVPSTFLCGDAPSTLTRAADEGFPVQPLVPPAAWDDDDATQTVSVAREQGADLVVVDSELAGPEYLARLRAGGPFVVAIDDLAAHPFPIQLVVNNNADADRLPYVSSSGDTEFLLGPRYALLGPEFSDLRLADGDPTGPASVLVVLGGADFLGLTPALVSALSALPAVAEVTAVVGPFAPNLDAVRAAAARAPRSVRVLHAPGAMAPLMTAATIAVSAAGQTLYRLACVGCPTVAVQAAENQRGQLAALCAAGAVEAVPVERGGDVAPVVAAAARLLGDVAARARMRRAGRALVDGRGAGRVAGAITARLGRPVRTR
jgi:UDP-2,4-diacetamido-2,4,6-trideoxy-beta-L-altropyranose hydrolase